MTKDNVKFIDDKRVYEEENTKLSQVLNELDVMIKEAYDRSSYVNQEIRTFEVRDRDDRERLQGLREIADQPKRTAQSLLDIRTSPYFMRIDIESDGKGINKYYIGEKPLFGKNQYCFYTIVHDWREPIPYAARYTRQKSFKIDNKKCDLYLRRAINIRDCKIESINTEFDSDALILGGNVIDPFLLSVLRDKRRNNKLTNIIKTIQQNQSEIISKPIEENFVVQGCAGSGKTMILLHRLSYLLYNYKNYSVDNYCILTPNEFFNLHINDLSKDLEIDKIKRFTVEKYYEELIKRMSHNGLETTSATDSGRRSMINSLLKNQLMSEKLLNDQMLSEIYSDQYISILTASYNEYWDKFVKIHSKQSYPALERLVSKPIPITLGFNYETYRNINSYYCKANSIIQENEKEMIVAREGLSASLKETEELQKVLEDSYVQLPNIQNKIEGKLNDTLNLCIEEENKLYSEENQLLDELEKLEKRKEQISVDLGNVFTNEESAMTDDELIALSYILESDTEFVRFIKLYSEKEISDIEKLQFEAKKIPFYNFGKKTVVNKQIDELIKEYKENALILLSEYKSSINTNFATLQLELKNIDNSTEIARKKLKDIQISQKVNIIKISKLENAISNFRNNDISSMEELFADSVFDFLKRDINKLVKLLEAIEIAKKSIILQEKKIKDFNTVIDQCALLNIDETVKNELTILKSTLDIIDINNIWKDFEEKLKRTYSKFNQEYIDNIKYRHKLYLLLKLCYLYYGAPTKVEKFINIDEAQDIAISEYRLLKDILGLDAIFNLYGDVNQLIYSYKGVTDWEELNEVASLNLYFLNENYRNTIQITDYCNKTFGADILAIGIQGDSVKNFTLSDGVIEMQKLHRSNPKLRTAIIYKKGQDDLALQASSILSSNECVMDIVDNNKISIITVETAKGLEFERVLVITDDMSINEKYISYTRALEGLLVT